MKEIISTPNAPAAIGPYSQAVRVGHLIYTAGQIALDPATMKVVEGDVQAQTHQVLKNLSAILEEAGSSLAHVVKTTVFLDSMDDYKAVNEVYAQYFEGSNPARSAVAVQTLPLNVLVEIEAVAVIDADDVRIEIRKE